MGNSKWQMHFILVGGVTLGLSSNSFGQKEYSQPLNEVPLSKVESVSPKTFDLKMRVVWPQVVNVDDPVVLQVSASALQDRSRVMYWPCRVNIEVRNSQGKVVPSKPSPEEHLQMTFSSEKGHRNTKELNLSNWVTINEPGRYHVRCEIIDRIVPRSDKKPNLETSLILDVSKRDAKQFERNVMQLLEIAEGNASPKSVSAPLDFRSAFQAIYSMRTVASLPYLEYLAKRYASESACFSIRQMGSPAAAEVIGNLAARKDKVGDAARRALKRKLPRDMPATKSKVVEDF